MTIRLPGLVFAVALAACTQQAPAPPQTQAPQAASSLETQTQVLLTQLTPVIAAELGAPVLLKPRHVRIMEDWAWVVALPQQANGAPMDWATTTRAGAYEHGAMDESGATYALLKQEAGAWRLVAHVIAPTDVAWTSWPSDYGAPAELFELPSAP